MSSNRKALLKALRRKASAGLPLVEAVNFLAGKDAGILDAIAVVRNVYRIRLGEACA
jgi:hypothetical protein